MSRLTRLFLWFVAGALVAGVPMLAFAAPTTDTHVDATATANLGRSWALGGSRPSGGFVLGSNHIALYNLVFPGQAVTGCSQTSGVWSCITNGDWRGYSFGPVSGLRCTVGMADPGVQTACAGNIYSCPSGQNWTLTGSSCDRPACAPGETRDSGGVCRAPACVAGMSLLNGVCVSDVCPDGSSRAVGGLCRGAACNGPQGPAQPPGVDMSIVTRCQTQGCQTTWWENALTSQLRTTGGECDPSAPPPPDDSCPAGLVKQTIGATTKCYPASGSCAASGQCSGIANGVTICFACPPGTETAQPSPPGSKESTTTPPGGPSTTTPGDSETVKETVKEPGAGGGGRVVTRETTVINPDGTKTVQKETAAITAYCEKYPNSPTCKAADDPCIKNPELLACKKLGAPVEGEALTIKPVGISGVVPVSVASNNSCPAPLELPHGWGTISYQPACDLAGIIKGFVLLLAWVSAAFIVMGGF